MSPTFGFCPFTSRRGCSSIAAATEAAADIKTEEDDDDADEDINSWLCVRSVSDLDEPEAIISSFFPRRS
jgi:hypothetical protein